MAMTLKAIRVNLRLNQDEAANILGVTARTLSSWENGVTFPDAKQIYTICKEYKVNYSDINFLISNVGENEEEG